MSNKKQFTHLARAALLCGAGAAFGAQPLPKEVLLRLAPAEQKAYVKAQIAERQADAGRVPALALDVTPPVLSVFSAGPSLDLRLAQPIFSVQVRATDDLSGLAYITFCATGPSGQYACGSAGVGYPTKVFSGKAGFYSPSPLMEPGVWNIDYAYLGDVAGNYGYYDQAALAALGNTTFTVASAAYDVVPPSLTSGTIQSPVVSLSSFAKGTSAVQPFIGARLKATDAGNTGLAGLQFAYASFCLADESRCISAYGSNYVGGQAATTLSISGQVSAVGNVPGVYYLRNLQLSDHAGNYQTMWSTQFGGTTDFSTLFPTTKITVKP